MNRAACILAIAAIGALSMRVEGHQLDEYLQATRLDIARGRIAVDLTLTPGVAVAPRVFGAIDRDGNHRVSPEEIRTYTLGVMRDLAVTVDGRPYPLTLAHADSSSWDELQDGTGAIRLKAFAAMPDLTRGSHRIRFENAHQSDAGVYLVNALAPGEAAIVIRAQHRDRQQRHIELDVEVEPASAGTLAMAMIGALLAALAGRAALTRPRRSLSSHADA